MAVSVIWDLDGTLFDSYKAIMDRLEKTFSILGAPFDREKCYEFIIRNSIKIYCETFCPPLKIKQEDFYEAYAKASSFDHEIVLFENAEEILRYLNEKGIKNYIFTNRGATTRPLLERLGILSYFEDIVTAADGYAHKPDPEGLLALIKRNNLNPNDCVYVGDRRIDIVCAQAANTKTILFSSSPFKEKGCQPDYEIISLLEIKEII